MLGRKILSIVSTVVLIGALLTTTAISCFASDYNPEPTNELYSKDMKTYRTSTTLYYTTMASIPGYTTVHTSSNGEDFNNNYKVAAYDEYKTDDKSQSLNHQWNGGTSYLVSTDPYQTVNDNTVRRDHYCDIKTGKTNNSDIMEYQYIIIYKKSKYN